MQLKIKKLHPDAIVPVYASEGAACFDLHSVCSGEIGPYGEIAIATGLALEIPSGHCLKVYSRSGHGFKNGIVLINGTGIIDSDYRGDLIVGLRNTSHYRFEFRAGDRIAQAMLVPVECVTFELADELSDTERGTGGFGSTGK